jgi:hypothetical protein
VPLHDWLRGPLREWADAKLDPARIARHGVFDPVGVRRVWEEHVRGYSNNTATLWPVLMFDGWASETLETDHAGAPEGASVADRLAHGHEGALR